MADGQLRAVIGQLRRLIGGQGGSSLSDAQLLEAFVSRRDEAAFEVLVWRHGTMVFNLCQRILHDAHQAEDAFQATFLVFVRKAGSIGKRESLGSWLYKVAFRIACRAKAKSARNIASVADVDTLSADDHEGADDVLWRDLKPVLDEEINRLPEKYRAPFVLCHMQGHTNEEAAQMLGCPKGTILSRLSRGREQLRSRLARRGVVLSVAWLATQLPSAASAASVPAVVVSGTIKASIPFAAGAAATGIASSSAATLAEGVLHAMFVAKIKLAAAAVLMLAVLGAGGGALAHLALADSSGQDRVAAVSPEAQIPQTTPGEPSAPSEKAPAESTPETEKPGEARVQTVSGRIVSVPFGRESFVLETSPRDRTEEAKKHVVKIGAKTVVTYNGVGPNGAQPYEGYGAVVRLENDEAVSIVFQGPENSRNHPELSGKVGAVARDGKGFTLEETTTGRERNEVPKKTALHFNDRTLLTFAAVAQGEAKITPGYRVKVWLTDDPAGNVVAKAQFVGVESRPGNRSELSPDLSGRVVALSRDGKTLSLIPQNRGAGAPRDLTPPIDLQLDDSTQVVFNNVVAGGTRISAGQQAAIWLAAGSKDQAVKVSITGNVPERWETVRGTVVAISNNTNRITLEIPFPQVRGQAVAEGTKRIDIVLRSQDFAPHCPMTFHGVGFNEAKLTIGYTATVRLADGSPDVAAEIAFTKPGIPRRR